jgi:pimeloyl-ACP methyl ester carboxylesterase
MSDAVHMIETTECRIGYREWGSGPPLLMLHGGGPGATGMGNFSQNIAHFAASRRVIVPDLPCFGVSRIVVDHGEPWERVCARALAEFTKALDIDGPVDIIGNSAGGGVAVRIALEQPGVVRRLILMAPWLIGFRLPLFTPGEMEGTPLLEGYFPNPSKEKMRNLVRTFVHDPSAFDIEALVDSRYAVSLQDGIAEGIARAFADIAYPASEPTILEQVRTLRVPTLVLWGKDDRFCSLDDALLWMACLADSRLVLFNRCGHWVQAERRDEFNAHVTAFLSAADAVEA